MLHAAVMDIIVEIAKSSLMRRNIQINPDNGGISVNGGVDDLGRHMLDFHGFDR